ncbi:DUF2231 domain-containing protein [Nonomuraea africana]|uniref:Membrane protein n=1 Tax=Nonomuraea africana TaxID=46171 RepID=A0ABR9KGJ1_9ACTN|nr:DUF2231 domain-containing protein [Nonomuraea africana]MBE1560906.1 putative membrane protein [Nonomuraea africana]
MFDEIMGLPAHPLIVHFAVVLTPLLVAAAVAYALVPRFQPYLAWAVVLLSLAAPAAVFAARQSGAALKQARFAEVGGELGQRIAGHESFATPLLFSTIGLGAASLLMVYLWRAKLRVPAWTLSAVSVVLAVVAGYYVFRAGDSGARAVWGL